MSSFNLEYYGAIGIQRRIIKKNYIYSSVLVIIAIIAGFVVYNTNIDKINADNFKSIPREAQDNTRSNNGLVEVKDINKYLDNYSQ